MGDRTVTDGMVRAILAYEFEELDTDGAAVVTAVRAGLLGDWVRAVADSGMMSVGAVRDLEAQWRADPELLVDALLDGVDEITRRRLTGSRVAVLPVAAERVTAG
ncbi:hypothetical protein ACFWQG_06710 [Rhodococcus sp. NPDC058532]|uniref:hypothetical protein n=1 Tax=Rhodococcus sp. NPDC058532 TaxID=3346540 RepID=UPI003655F110